MQGHRGAVLLMVGVLYLCPIPMPRRWSSLALGFHAVAICADEFNFQTK